MLSEKEKGKVYKDMRAAQNSIRWSPTKTCSRKVSVNPVSTTCNSWHPISPDVTIISLHNVLHGDCGLYSVLGSLCFFVIVSRYPRWQQEPNEMKPKLTFQAEWNKRRNCPGSHPGFCASLEGRAQSCVARLVSWSYC